MNAELLEAARNLVPGLRDRSGRCEAERRVPPETIAELAACGLTRMTQPKKFGGYELAWHSLCEVIAELAKGCASTAWVCAVFNEFNQRVANLPMAAQEEVWREKDTALICSGNSPAAISTEVEGGYRLTGEFQFSSGCDHADWHVLTARQKDGSNPRFHLIPGKDRTILDDWQVYGMAGTGSKSLRVEDVFVPGHRTAPVQEWGNHYGNPMYRMPQFSANGFVLASVCIGAATGALDELCRGMRERSSRFGEKIGAFQSLQLRIAESAAELDAAKRIMREDLAASAAYLEENPELSRELMAVNKRDMAFGTVLARRAVDRLFYAAGAQGLFLDGALQRHFRDVHAGASQLVLNWDINASVYGKLALGVDLGPVRW